MAKIKHNNFLNTVNEVFTDATNEGVLHLYADLKNFSGRTISIKNQKLFHFGTTSYLGLGQDRRLKAASIEAIETYGTQFPLSKTYVSNPLYTELELCLKSMYNHPIIITKNSTLGHMGAIPSAVDDQDAIILDHQVHWSVQNAAKYLKNRSVPIDMIRHNDLNMLEDKIKTLSNRYRRIWYMIDGIYSMYGDFAPIRQLESLCKKYPQLFLYIDDVHGMSWAGKNGTGYAMSQLEELNDQMLLFGTLSKTFGASGAVLVCPDVKLYKKIKTFGGPLTFSAQLEPASVAAAIASAKIHLSSEIYELQRNLKERIDAFNLLLGNTELPLIDVNESPVFFIGTGMPKTGYNFVKRLMKEGFFVNLGIFPAVPVKNTGIRVTISSQNELSEMEKLVKAMEYHYPKALEDTNTDLTRVQKAFKLQKRNNKKLSLRNDLKLIWEESIHRIDKELWNSIFVSEGVFDWEGLEFLETTFSDNETIEHNWKFYYMIIKDANDMVVLATYMSVSIWKDDMLAKSKVSEEIEKLRLSDPFHLTSRVLSLGSLFTEGSHLYLNREHKQMSLALDLMHELLEKLEIETDSKMIVLRDLKYDKVLHEYFQGQGFVRIQMPSSCYIELEPDVGIDEFGSKLSSRNRRHLRKEILDLEDSMEIEVCSNLQGIQLDQVEVLYNNVHNFNTALNTFSFPRKLFENISSHPKWEFIVISERDKHSMIGVMLCYINQDRTYVPSFVGLDYAYLKEYHVYRQLLYQTIKRAINLKVQKIDFGMTAVFEKRKLGATIVEKFAYIQTSDNYKIELMGLLEGN